MQVFVAGAFVIGGVFLWLEFTRPGPPAVEESVLLLEVEKQAPVVVAEVEAPGDSSVPEVARNDSPVVTPPPEAESPPESAEPAGAEEPVGFGKEAVLVLTGLDSRRENALKRDKELFDRAVTSREWNAYRGFLAKSLDAGLAGLGKGQGVNRFDALWSEPVFYQTFLRWQVLGRLSQADIAQHVTDTYTGGTLTWLCYNPKAMEEFLLTFKPQDDGGKVLGTLMNTLSGYMDEPEKMEKYFPLALACAVVFDREIGIPHPVANQKYSDDSSAKVEPMERFRWFMEKNEKGKLAAPVHQSSARDLVWVVCAPVSTSELEWSLDKLHLRRKNWGDAYGMVEYLMERAVKGLNPYKEYSFAEILKEGGICGDQSYFCANTARAQGIPAMIFVGETDLGPHAWVGFKVKPDEWTTGVGRVGGVSKGETENPQTGGAITEQEVRLWNDRAHQSPQTTLAVARHLWLADYFTTTGKEEPHAEAVKLANKIAPAFIETWAALYSLLKKQTKLTGEPAKPSNLEEWKDFAKSMRREFKDNPRMAKLAADAEMEYIFPYGEDNDATRTLLRERRRIARDSGEQKDLIAESLKREADIIAKRGGPNVKQDISRLYDTALRKYGGSITGFKMMAEDYFGFFKDDPELARKAARDIELAFKRVVETGTKDWFRAQTESTIYQMICGYYRAAGDEGRAVLLEKRYQLLLKRAERGSL